MDVAPASDGKAQLAPTELEAWRGLLRTHRDLVSRLDQELERDHGLPLTSYEVLMLLSDAPGGSLRMGDLASALLLSRSGLTRLVDRLERDGLVRRVPCPEDARGLLATITQKGEARLAKARPAHLAGVRRHFLDRLRSEDLRALSSAWSRLGSGDP